MRNKLLVLFLLIAATVSAQQYNFINYTAQDGLAQSQVRDICEDEQGYLWVGTSGGLSQFNGIEFVNYSVDDGLPDNNIRKLYLSKKGKLWIATPKGVAYYSKGAFTSFPFKDSYRINGIAEFKGDIHFASNTGLIRFKNEEFDLLENDSTTYFLRTITNYKDSVLFFGSTRGILTWDGEKMARFPLQGLDDDMSIRDIKIEGDLLYFTSRDVGVVRCNLRNGKCFRYPLDYNTALFLNVHKNIVFGTSATSGAFMIKGDEILYFSEENGLNANNFKCLYRDTESNIWLGTDGQGLLKFSGTSVVTYTERDSLSSKLVLSISQNKNGTYTFGTYDEGVTKMRLPEKRTEYFSYPDKLVDNTIWSIELDASDNLWVGTSNGLTVLDDEDEIVTNLLMADGRKIRTILHLDNGQKTILGGDEGLAVIVGDSVNYLHDSLNVNKLFAQGDKIYCGGFNGLYVFDKNGNFETLKRINLPAESVNTLTADKRGNLWIGTMNGLFVMNQQGIIYRFLLDELDYRSKWILGLIHSTTNSIWVSTMSGVYEIAESRKDKRGYKINSFGSSEGFSDEECNINALYEDNRGFIWVGTAGGLVKIDPSQNDELFDYDLPKLHITGIRLFMETFDYSDFPAEIDETFNVPNSITLPHSKNYLTFDFIGINLKDPNAVQYEHRMIGVTEQWSPLSKSNEATYSFLPPGDYKFEVKAMNKSNEWSVVKSIDVVIRPPFWKSWWFVSLSILVGVGIVILIFRARISALKQRQENEKLDMKNRLLFLEQRSLNASMNRHFIFNSLNSIQYFINSSDKLSANRFLSNFAKLIRKNLDSSASTNFIVTLQEEIERIELYLALEKMRFSDKFQYEVIVSSSLDTESIEIPSMILQPFVENSIIHGVLSLENEGHISIEIYEDLGEVIFVVQDNGIGIDYSLASKTKGVEGDHESKGVEITNRRIELLRKLTGENLLIIGPFQMDGPNGEILGTKVILKLGGAHKFEG